MQSETRSRDLAIGLYCQLNGIDWNEEKVDQTDHFERWYATVKAALSTDAEPVRWMWEERRGSSDIWDFMYDDAKPEPHAYIRNVTPLYAPFHAPSVAVKADRETIARIIDPHSFLPDNSGDDLTGEMVKQGKDLAYSKADRVIASLSAISIPDEPKRVKLDASGMKFGSCQQCDVRDNLGIDEDGSMVCGSCSDANHLAEWIDYARSLRSALSAQVQDVAEYERREQVCRDTALSQWERSLKRPDLTEKDRVIGAIEAYKRQAFAFTMLPAAPAAKQGEAE